MGFFGNDDFFGGGIDELFNRLASEGVVEYSTDSDGRRKVVKRGRRNVLGKILLNKVATEKRIYYIFDLTDKENITAKIKKSHEGVKLIEVKENNETIFEFPLEENETEDFKFNFINGLLEASYKQWKTMKL